MFGLVFPPGAGRHTWRARVTLADGRRLFAKGAIDQRGHRALDLETRIYRRVEARWVPRPAADRPGLLLVEDLSGAVWPPPWPSDLTPLWSTLNEVADTDPGMPLPRIERVPVWEDRPEWVDPVWFRRYARRLRDLASQIDPTGDAFVHGDLGAGNLCFADRGPVLVDWEFASRADRWFDVATVSMELIAEGRPPAPILPHPEGWVAWLSGVLASDRRGLTSVSRLAEAGVTWLAERQGWPPPRVS